MTSQQAEILKDAMHELEVVFRSMGNGATSADYTAAADRLRALRGQLSASSSNEPVDRFSPRYGIWRR
jgi:hypothetical protein